MPTQAPWIVEYDNSETGQWYTVGPVKVEFRYNDPIGEKSAEADAKLISKCNEMRDMLIALRHSAFLAEYLRLSEIGFRHCYAHRAATNEVRVKAIDELLKSI